jgi:hypothetical protein
LSRLMKSRSPGRPTWTERWGALLSAGMATGPIGWRHVRARLARVFLGLLLVASLLEVGARVLLRLSGPLALTHGLSSASWRLDWVARHRDTRGPSAGGYAFDEFHPTRGWSTRRSIHDLPAWGTLVNTNARGLRGKRDYAYAPDPATQRVVVLGDSFTFGEEVSDGQTYPYLLEKQLDGMEVLNLGVHGYGHDQMLLYLQEEGLRYSPDVVALGFVVGDVFRNLLTFRDFAKPRFILESGTLVLTNSPVPSPQEVLARELFQVKSLDLVSIAVSDVARGSQIRSAEIIARAILNEIVQLSRRSSALNVLVYLPTGRETLQDLDRSWPGEEFFFRVCDELGVACLSLRSQFLRDAQEWKSFDPEGHWTAEIHRSAARAIGPFLKAFLS